MCPTGDQEHPVTCKWVKKDLELLWWAHAAAGNFAAWQKKWSQNEQIPLYSCIADVPDQPPPLRRAATDEICNLSLLLSAFSPSPFPSPGAPASLLPPRGPASLRPAAGSGAGAEHGGQVKAGRKGKEFFKCFLLSAGFMSSLSARP